MSDDLRAKLTGAMIQQARMGRVHIDYGQVTAPYVGALLPVVREALADAWDEGHDDGYDGVMAGSPKARNPYRSQP